MNEDTSSPWQHLLITSIQSPLYEQTRERALLDTMQKGLTSMHKSLCFRDLAGSQRKEALYHNMINTKHLMESTDDGGREFQTHQGWASFSFLRSYACGLSCIQLFLTLWTIACKAPLSMGFSRQEYWSGVPFPSPADPRH